MPFSKEQYPDIPDYSFENLKTQSHELLDAANQYYYQNSKVYKLKQSMEEKLEKEKKILKDLDKKFRSLCKHNFIPEPREYHSSREWTCSICGLSC